MKNAIEIAKQVIVESQEAGQQEMSIRRTNVGTAGVIATKVSNRDQYDEDGSPLSIDEQAARLAERMSADEIEYAEGVYC